MSELVNGRISKFTIDKLVNMAARFGNMRLDRIDHVRVSAWFDAASAERSGAANCAFEMLRTMLRTARQGARAPHCVGRCISER
ncbi:hypothetical protein [Candidatus Rariloculus sp.]|uniref:hypothetical protein n=1 Tax=Candidatus Rariloculus sp. TaxID=3101265 RepID=UPI003D14F04C